MEERDEYSRAGSRRIISRWRKGGTRYDNKILVDDGRWQRTRRGWRYKQDRCGQRDYCERRRETPGFFRGAAVTLVIRGRGDAHNRRV